ncbi:MAG: hypothetical protein ACE5JD_13490 [Candidatus Methylomirabilia bacterium]
MDLFAGIRMGAIVATTFVLQESLLAPTLIGSVKDLGLSPLPSLAMLSQD